VALQLCPFISNIMMVGDKRKCVCTRACTRTRAHTHTHTHTHTHRFNTAVVTLKCVGATGEEPGTDALVHSESSKIDPDCNRPQTWTRYR
jgi:hypothetical protein